jgi:hypothetical protein
MVAVLALAWMAWTLTLRPHRTTAAPPVTVTMPAPPPSTVALPPATLTLPPTTVTLPPITVTPPPRPITPRHYSPAEDEQLLNRLRALGWDIHNPSVVVDNARTACLLMHEGRQPEEVVDIIVAETEQPLHDARQLVASAEAAYC